MMAAESERRDMVEAKKKQPETTGDLLSGRLRRIKKGANLWWRPFHAANTAD